MNQTNTSVEQLPLEQTIRKVAETYAKRLGIFFLVIAMNFLLLGLIIWLPRSPIIAIFLLGIAVVVMVILFGSLVLVFLPIYTFNQILDSIESSPWRSLVFFISIEPVAKRIFITRIFTLDNSLEKIDIEFSEGILDFQGVMRIMLKLQRQESLTKDEEKAHSLFSLLAKKQDKIMSRLGDATLRLESLKRVEASVIARVEHILMLWGR